MNKKGCFGSFTMFSVSDEPCASCPDQGACAHQGALNAAAVERELHMVISKSNQAQFFKVPEQGLVERLVRSDFKAAVMEKHTSYHAAMGSAAEGKPLRGEYWGLVSIAAGLLKEGHYEPVGCLVEDIILKVLVEQKVLKLEGGFYKGVEHNETST